MKPTVARFTKGGRNRTTAGSRSLLTVHPVRLKARPCRGCSTELVDTFVDLGFSPLSNDYLSAQQLNEPLATYPLHAYVCRSCFLVQLQAFEEPERHFAHYAYFSSFSSSWLAHAKAFAAEAIARFSLGKESFVVELASNDGYLLQYFAAAGIRVLGIEPAANVAAAALAKGISTETGFFGVAMARSLTERGIRADLIIANNVLAHVPNLHDFVAGIALLLANDGTASIEFPHFVNLLHETQFDTIYHEHFSYFSLLALAPVFAAHGLLMVDVEQLSTHGGSLRLSIGRSAGDTAGRQRVDEMLTKERAGGFDRLETYRTFAQKVSNTRDAFVHFLLDARAAGKNIAAYGAPAKGNTFLNYCGIRADQIAFTTDRNPHKQHLYLPGSLIPIYPPAAIAEKRPDVVVILPWNLRNEIVADLAAVRSWGGRFAVAIPQLEIF